MTISQRIFEELKKQGKKQKELADYIGISTSAISDWKKKGTNPAAENISAIADFLKISTDYLLTGNERSDNPISHSAVGAVGNHSSGTVTINNNSVPSEIKPENKDLCSSEQTMSENAKELLEVFESLPKREQIKLLSIVFEYEEKYRGTHK